MIARQLGCQLDDGLNNKFYDVLDHFTQIDSE